MFLAKWKAPAVGLAVVLFVVGAAGGDKEEEPPAKPKKIAPFDGNMQTRGQKAQPRGGKAVLYSRNRYGNYPVATYDFTLGLRGDDERVANRVDLVFGNRERKGTFAGREVDRVKGTGRPSAGAAGMGGRLKKDIGDEFHVGLVGNCQHAIVDCGKVDFAKVAVPAELVERPGKNKRRKEQAVVAVGHVYVIHIYDAAPATRQDHYVKVRVLRHQDNDAVEIEWAPLALPKRKGE
jgi:hypothetical protein